MICASISDTNLQSCLSSLKSVDMAEIRLDLTHYGNEEIRQLFSNGKKMIATCRPGQYDLSEREEILKTAIEAGATYVDIEFEAEPDYRERLIDFAHCCQCDVIISYHNHDLTPELNVLEKIMQQCFEMGADVAKIATTALLNRDNSKIMSLYRAPGRLVAFCMGDLGKISRVVAPFLGAEFTYAYPDSGKPTASGQISYSRLNRFILEIQQI